MKNPCSIEIYPRDPKVALRFRVYIAKVLGFSGPTLQVFLGLEKVRVDEIYKDIFHLCCDRCWDPAVNLRDHATEINLLRKDDYVKIECNIVQVFPCEWVKAIASFKRLGGIFVRVLHRILGGRDLVLYREFPAGEPYTVVNSDLYSWSSQVRGINWEEWIEYCGNKGVHPSSTSALETFCKSRDLLSRGIWSVNDFADVVLGVLTRKV